MKKIGTLFALCLLLTSARAQAAPAAFQRTTTQQRAPAPRRLDFDFPALVLQGQGRLTFSVRKEFGDSDNLFGAKAPNTAEGHRYFSLNSLGRSGLSPAQVMGAIMKDLNSVFPMEARDMCGMGVEVGNRFNLHIEYKGHEFRPNYVEVTDKTPYYFTVATLPDNHTFKGELTHGIFRDSTGELWMFQDGMGVSGQESVGQIIANDAAAFVLWKIMAGKVKDLMAEMSLQRPNDPDREDPRGSNADVSQAFLVNSYVNTGIQVKCGDMVTIRASGRVTFGDFAGSGGPEGIIFNTDYNYFPDLLHGCLIGRLSMPGSGGWGYVGREYVGKAEQSGVLELDVNDNDPGNNRGAFRVEVTVRRAR